MPDITLYNAPQSTCSQRVRFVLNAKNIAFSEVKLDLFSGDQLKPEYLKLNPNGVVPTIVDDGAVIVDSAVIMEYLDERHPEPSPFRPKNLVDARASSLAHALHRRGADAGGARPFLQPRLPSAFSGDERRGIPGARGIEAAQKRVSASKMGRTGFSEEEMNSALDRLKRAVGRMHDAIAESGGPFMMGADVTLADIAIMPVIVRLDDIGLSHFWDDKPEISRWFERIKAHPAFKPTYYFGALLTEKYPHLAEKFGRERKPG